MGIKTRLLSWRAAGGQEPEGRGKKLGYFKGSRDQGGSGNREVPRRDVSVFSVGKIMALLEVDGSCLLYTHSFYLYFIHGFNLLLYAVSVI